MESGPIHLYRYIAVVAAIWTLAVAGLFTKNAFKLKETIVELATAEARVHYSKDRAIQQWVSAHGGLYVPVTEKTPPNPFLDTVPERDIQTPSGKPLTLMNAVYMIRELTDYYSQTHGVKAHVTSLNHCRPETAPDEWEKAALNAFEQGRSEVLDITEIDGAPYLRLMRPLVTETGCLKCHANQGYAVGDTRGGASVSIPMGPYLGTWRSQLVGSIFSFAVLWAVGVIGLGVFSSRLSRRLREREQAQASLRVSQENYRILVDNSLTGIYVVQNGRIVFANAEFARIHGYTLNELIGMESLSLVHPEERSAVAERIEKRFRGDPVSDHYQTRCLTKTGGVIWVQRRNALTTYDGRPAILGNEIDVTHHMLADAELEASERQLQRLADGLIELREIERHQFATEIHENIAQSLSAIKIRVESVVRDIDDNALFCEPLRPIITDVQNTVAEIRKMAQRYRPMGLDHLGIILTLDWLCRQTARENPNLRISKSIHLLEDQVPEALKIIIFRIVEQVLYGLSNQARADVYIGLEMVAERLFLTLTTNVSAADLSKAPSKGYLRSDLAIITLKRHVESFGGTFLMTTGPGRQTTLIASWENACTYPAPGTR